MSARGAIGCVVLLAACGRIGFPSSGTGDDVPDDGDVDDGATDDTRPLLDCTSTYPDAHMCSTFEGPGMGDWDYTVVDQGTVTLSTARAYRGTQSLEIQTMGVDAYKAARWGRNYVFDEVDAGDIYIRGYYWLASSTMVTDQLSILVVANSVDPYPSANVMLAPGVMHSVVDGTNVMAPHQFPRDRWTCLLMHIDVGDTGAIEIFVDGTPVLSRSNFDTRVAGGYTNLDVGVHYATPGQSASHLWIDEVVADTSPVTCD